MTLPVEGELSRQELKDSAVGGFLVMSMGNGARAVLKIGVLALLGRLLTPGDFGLVAAAGVVVWLSGIFSSLGVGPALIQRPELEARHISTGFAITVVLGVVAAALVYLLAPSIALLFQLDRLTPILRGMALVFPIAGISVVAECLLQRQLQFRTIAGVELAGYAVGYGVVGVGMAWLGYGAWSLVGAEVTKTVLKSALFLKAVPHSVRLRLDRNAFAELIRFGSAYTAGSLSIYFASQSANFVIARFLGATALGLYGRAYELMLVPAQALGVVLDKILFPTLSKVQGDPARLHLAYRRCTALVALLVLPLSAVTIALAPEIIRALLGSGWEEAVLPLQILAVSMYFRVGYMIGHSVANATGAVHKAAWYNAVYAVLVVAGAVVGQRWGVVGVAGGVTLAVTINFAMVFRLGGRIAGFRWTEFLALHVPALSLAGVAGVGSWITAAVSRSAGIPAVVTLAAAVTVVLLTMLLVMRVVPHGRLGEDGVWMLQAVYRLAPGTIQPFLRRVMKR